MLREAGLDLNTQLRWPPAKGIRRDYKQLDKFLFIALRQDSSSNTRRVLQEMN